MMVSGARKGFWGVPPYERLGGRGVVSVPQMVKGRSLRLIALGVLLCCALALGGCGGGRKGGSLPPAESGSFEGPKGSIADLRRLPQDLLVYARQGNPDKPLMSAAEQARQDARFNSLFFGPWEAVRSSVSASVRHFRRPEEAEQGAGMGGKPVAVDAGELGQADGERRSGCVPVPVRQGDYRAAHGAARSAHP